MISNSKGDLGLILPILSIYAIAGVKLLPALQQIYSSIATIRGNLSAYESIREDLINIKTYDAQKNEPSKLHSVFVSGYVLTLQDKVLKDKFFSRKHITNNKAKYYSRICR